MPCFSPAEVWPAPPPAKGVVWARNKSYVGAKSFQVPCGQCIGCRLDKAQDWSTRIYHEASLHENNSFITLTYSDDYMPLLGTLVPRDLQLFFKRLRKAKGAVRYFACGEYGEETRRPHYHAILFGQDFAHDRKPWRRSPTGHVLYRSALLEKLWPYGHSEIGSVTHESAGYVARYCLKKVAPSSDRYKTTYERVVPETGEVGMVHPEFARMSNRPGIGDAWLQKYQADAFPSDFVVVDGSKRPVPAFYMRKLKEKESLPEREILKITSDRKLHQFEHVEDRTPERLAVREEVLARKVTLLNRSEG